MSYCTTTEVLNAAGVTTTEVTAAKVQEFIDAAEKKVDRFTQTTYWNIEDSGTATSGTSTTLTDTAKTFTVNDPDFTFVWIYGGTGSGQARKISSNTADTLTVDSAWGTNPSTDSTYRIIHTGSDPLFNESIDGTGNAFLFVQKRPIQILQSLTIDSTAITTSAVFIYKQEGKFILNTDSSEESIFKLSDPQQIALAYWHGFFEDAMPEDVKRYCIVLAAINTLQTQMGGTHNIPSTYQTPEASVTIGQAYINIDFTRKALEAEKKDLEKDKLKVYNILMVN